MCLRHLTHILFYDVAGSTATLLVRRHGPALSITLCVFFPNLTMQGCPFRSRECVYCLAANPCWGYLHSSSYSCSPYPAPAPPAIRLPKTRDLPCVRRLLPAYRSYPRGTVTDVVAAPLLFDPTPHAQLRSDMSRHLKFKRKYEEEKIFFGSLKSLK